MKDTTYYEKLCTNYKTTILCVNTANRRIQIERQIQALLTTPAHYTLPTTTCMHTKKTLIKTYRYYKRKHTWAKGTFQL